MATYQQVGYGAKGNDVTELQKLLNNNGYALDVDGSFGPKTQAAVKDYQQKNGLKVDGIVGNNTWGALTKATTQTTTQPSANKEWSYDPFQASSETTAANKNRQEVSAQKPGDFSYGTYEKSDVVKQAEALLQQQLANKPGAYQSQWQTALDDTMNKILNREKFSYDLNGDALYQQYKDQYITQGQQAMMDTMGQAAAMTGGYGNSYAQTVGQQTYQGYLQQLNDRVPELYQLALDQYNREGDDLYNQYGMYADRENQDYGRYRDTVSDYYTETDRLTEDARYQGEQDYGKYMDQYNMSYGQYRDTVSDWQQEQARADENYWNLLNRDYTQYSDDRNLSYQQNRDKKADEQWQAEFDEAKRQYDQQYALSKSSKSSSGNPSGDKTGNPAVDPEPTPAPDGQVSTVPDSIVDKVAGYSNNNDLANYLDGLTSSGAITEDQADALYAEYKQVDQAALGDRSWSLVDDGGINWFWGIDNNATVKDQYGNTYRLDKLVDALVADGMSKDDAKAYVKQLQAKLGA